MWFLRTDWHIVGGPLLARLERDLRKALRGTPQHALSNRLSVVPYGNRNAMHVLGHTILDLLQRPPDHITLLD